MRSVRIDGCSTDTPLVMDWSMRSQSDILRPSMHSDALYAWCDPLPFPDRLPRCARVQAITHLPVSSSHTSSSSSSSFGSRSRCQLLFIQHSKNRGAFDPGPGPGRRDVSGDDGSNCIPPHQLANPRFPRRLPFIQSIAPGNGTSESQPNEPQLS